MCSDIGYQEQPDVILVHSENVVVMEQSSFMLDSRTLVLICVNGVGYGAIGKRVPAVGYLTLGRWQIETRAAITFHVPNNKSMSVQQVPTARLLARYQSEIDLWVTISTAMRYQVQHVVTR
jgi:hypothetical protein